MITHNPDYLDNTDIFTPNEIKSLEELNQKVSLGKFLNNKSYIDKFGLDFIYTSALYSICWNNSREPKSSTTRWRGVDNWMQLYPTSYKREARGWVELSI